jgi:hypothetical protein
MRDMHRGINKFKNGNHPRTTLVNYKNGDLLADRWKKTLNLLKDEDGDLLADSHII